MTKIVWVSRHDMTMEQKRDLERIYGEVKIEKYDKTVNCVNEFMDITADVYAVVLPIEKIAELFLYTNKDIIHAVSKRVECGTTINPATGKEETQYAFKHICWKKYWKVDIQESRL